MRAGRASDDADAVAVEEPLEIRLQGTSFVVTMRTPGADRELAAGFLLSERVISAADDIRSLAHCRDTPDVGNVLDVMLRGSAADRMAALMETRRLVVATSACGVCGRRSIGDVMEAIPRVAAGGRVEADVIAELPARLRQAQHVFDQTGGLHAAGIFSFAGTLTAFAEDVGRHNAVDKAIGARLLAGDVPLSSHVLCVSGRTSFEIVQKAVMAGIPMVVAVSAPSSLSIDLAHEAQLTLVGFARGRSSFNVYTHPGRVLGLD